MNQYKIFEPVKIFWIRTIFLNQNRIFWTGTKYFERVQNFLNQHKIFWTGTKCFNLGQFDLFFFVFFCVKQKYVLGHRIDLLFISNLPVLTLTYYSLPALPPSQPLFVLPQCLPCEPWTTDLWFSFGFMSWCLTGRPWRLGCKFPSFVNYIIMHSTSNTFP